MRFAKYSPDWWLFEARISVLPTGQWVPYRRVRFREKWPMWRVKRLLIAALKWPAVAFRAVRTRLAVARLEKQMAAARPFLLANDMLPGPVPWWESTAARHERIRRASKRLSGMYQDGLVAT